MANIICVIVTYNRLALLKEAIEAVRKQTYPVSKIIIVDNKSTDDTPAYLSTLADDPLFQIRTLPENTGGSGGFSEGIKLAAHQHPDWIWLMDDDTIPNNDALERMMPFAKDDRIGYINSLVLWTDGTPHLMNGVKLNPDKKVHDSISAATGIRKEAFESIIMASFVSLLIRGDIPWKIGLPYKEFFIWCDDAEYTGRISNSGYYGVRASDSIVIHKTAVNYVSSLKTMPAAQAWKMYYGVRNESFLRRKRKGWIRFFFAQLNCFRTHVHRIKSRHLPKEEEALLLRENSRGLWDGFTFSPKIEYLE